MKAKLMIDSMTKQEYIDFVQSLCPSMYIHMDLESITNYCLMSLLINGQYDPSKCIPLIEYMREIRTKGLYEFKK